MVSIVAHKKVLGFEKENMFLAVQEAMELARWREYVKGKDIFLKVNLLSDQLVPGQCTSPWIVEGVVKELMKGKFTIYIGDANVATSKQVERAAKFWGISTICKKYEIKFVNLSNQSLITIDIGGKIFREIGIPEILLDVDGIITLPVIKTHNVTGMTCSLKNQWGCIPSFRHQYHLVADQCIADINKFLNVVFVVADGTVCMEGNGPRVGIPKIMNSVFASHDRVAMDCVACDLMEIDPKTIGMIQRAKEMSVGETDVEIVGDKLETSRFKPPNLSEHPIVNLELKLRKVPIINYLLFKTPLFKAPAYIASKYNSFWWYNKKGKQYTEELIQNNPLYRNEFAERWEKYK